MGEHESILKALMPVEVEGREALTAVRAKHLDGAWALVEQLLNEMFIDRSVELISDWERLLGIIPGVNNSLPQRRDRAISRLRARGGLSKPFFISLAAALGHTIEIENFYPFVCGVGVCGEPVADASIVHQWRVRGVSQDGYAFICGEAQCGDSLGSFSSSIEELFNKLKPATTVVDFEYDY